MRSAFEILFNYLLYGSFRLLTTQYSVCTRCSAPEKSVMYIVDIALMCSPCMISSCFASNERLLRFGGDVLYLSGFLSWENDNLRWTVLGPTINITRFTCRPLVHSKTTVSFTSTLVPRFDSERRFTFVSAKSRRRGAPATTLDTILSGFTGRTGPDPCKVSLECASACDVLDAWSDVRAKHETAHPRGVMWVLEWPQN